MKKKLALIVTLASLMTLSAGITAFAGWDVDEWGYTVFRDSNGHIVYAGWVTDPDTGYEYYMDPDGHMMTGTTIEGYWLDDDGIKHEKSDAQIRAEEHRAEREAAYRSPGKEMSETNDIANEAKTSGIALTTTRRNYQAEMYSITNNSFDYIKKNVTDYENKTLHGASSKTNISNKFYYINRGGVEIISSDMPKAVDGTEAYYDYALELHYNRNVMHDETVEFFDEGFRRMVVGALGEVQGEYVYNEIMAMPVGDDSATLNFTGTTDTGNSYSVRYSTNNAYVYVTCSEIVSEADEAADEAEEAVEGEIAEEAEAIAEDYIAWEETTNDVVISEEAQEQLEEDISEDVAEEIEEEIYEEEYEDVFDEDAEAEE